MSESTTVTQERPLAAEETRVAPSTDAALQPQESQQADTQVAEPAFATAEDYLASLETGKGSEGAAPESTPRRPAVDPAEVQNRIQYHRNQHATAQSDLDKGHASVVEELVDRGFSKVEAERIIGSHTKAAKDKLNEIYANGLAHAGFEASQNAVTFMHENIVSSIRKNLGDDFKHWESAFNEMAKTMPNGIVPLTDAFSIFQEQARRGYVTKKDHDAAIVTAFKEGRKIGERDAASGSSGRGVNGSSASGSGMTLRQWQGMTLEQRAEAERKDPLILEKIT